jgi:hypothetical protein
MRLGLNAALAEAEGLTGRSVGVKGQLVADLTFWVARAAMLPAMTEPGEGARHVTACTDASGLPTLAWGGVVWGSDVAPPPVDDAIARARSSAAGPNGIAFEGGTAFAGPTPGALASASSSALEVYAVRRVLRAYRAREGKDSLRGCRVRWLCDSQVALGAVGKWRAKAEGLVEQVHLLLDEARSWGCSIHPTWVSRDAGWEPVADALSKVRWRRDSAEWSVPKHIITGILARARMQPQVDLFATGAGVGAEAFVSLYPEAGALWCDAFSRSWRGLCVWAFPPFSAAAATLRHAARAGETLSGIFVVPRGTAVPARLRVVDRWALPQPLRLLDCRGRRAFGRCPVALEVLVVGANGG